MPLMHVSSVESKTISERERKKDHTHWTRRFRVIFQQPPQQPDLNPKGYVGWVKR